MTSNIAIKVEKVSKRYVLGEKASYLTLRDKLVELPMRLFKGPAKTKEFWALRDVSFEVKKGEVVGIIGRNGAGKSTLLKILARITEPTSGQVTMYGRVASMLEVGTGFNPELTGRENIYLNGAIIGMKKAEIAQKFDEIVTFAGVEKFLDTPVKHYSSGMYVRLAFAVAAHLDADILLVDEVLAVGDAEFQKKCLGKMNSLASTGKTIIYVSHNHTTIRSLCTKVIFLADGTAKASGNPAKVLAMYHNIDSDTLKPGIYQEKINKDKPFQVLAVELKDKAGKHKYSFENSETMILHLKLKNASSFAGLYGYLTIKNQENITVLESDSFDAINNPLDDLAIGMYSCRLTIPPKTFTPGKYQIYLNFTTTRSEIYPYPYPGVVANFEMHDTMTKRGNNRLGYIGATINWEVELYEQ